MKRTAAIIFKSIILLLAGIAIGLLLSDNDFSKHKLFTRSNKVSKVLQLVRDTYVDSVNVDSIEGATVNDMLQNLDPHSLYLPPQQALSINEKLEGGYNGIGIEYVLLRDTLVITQVTPQGPAAKAGLMPGDKVIEVAHEKFSGTHLTIDRVSKTFRGAKDSQLLLSVLAPQKGALKFYVISRGHVDESSLDAAYMVAPVTGYIKISKFASTTDADFRVVLAKLKKQGMQKLVLDLRDNGGGYLNTATALADEFLTKNKLIVYTKGIHEPRTDYLATDSGKFQQGKLAVLINEYSASASEILSGALQDLDRAVIVGRRSFGKGLVQEQFPFDDGSAVNLTVARYYTPSGRSIQKSYKNGIESYRNELADRVRKGELISEQNYLNDSTFKRPSPYHTSTGRKVFSGGGIMPDVFVPADTAHRTVLIQELSNQQLFSAYVIDRLQPSLKKYPSEDDFLKQYSVNDQELGDFIMYASQTIKEMDSQELLISKPYLKTLIKSFAARFNWGDNAFYKSLNADDPVLRKGIEAVK
ncbi:MAG: family peptidase [Mucilaginibacter sp.]|nr:family peptidase [Mucilaginibacter sp.]